MSQSLYKIAKDKESGYITLACQYWEDSDYFAEMDEGELAWFILSLYGHGYGDAEYSFEDAMTIMLKIKSGDYAIYQSNEEKERQWQEASKKEVDAATSYEELCVIAEARGYKIGWAYYKAKERGFPTKKIIKKQLPF